MRLLLLLLVSGLAFAGPKKEEDKVVKLNAGEGITIQAQKPELSPLKGEACQNADTIGTKVICNCQPTEKIVEKKVKVPVTKWKTRYKDRVKWKTREKVVEKKVPVTKWKTREVVKWKTRTVEKPVDRIITKEVPVYKKNNLSLFVGQGPNAVEIYKYDDEYRARDGEGIIGGLMYQRHVTPSWTVGFGGSSNESYFGTTGFSW